VLYSFQHGQAERGRLALAQDTQRVLHQRQGSGRERQLPLHLECLREPAALGGDPAAAVLEGGLLSVSQFGLSEQEFGATAVRRHYLCHARCYGEWKPNVVSECRAAMLFPGRGFHSKWVFRYSRGQMLIMLYELRQLSLELG